MLSIIITHHQTPILLKLCLKSIKESLNKIQGYEIIITDSEAEPNAQELIKEKFPEVKFVSFPKNVGYAKLVNSGIKKAKGDFLLFLNADIIVHQSSITQLLEFIKSDPKIGIVGPQLLAFNNQVQNSCFRFPTPGALLARRTFMQRLNWGKKKLDNFLMEDIDFSSPQSVDWLQGSAMLTRKEAIEKVGLWDERFFVYFEDTDWCRRFWRNNYQVVYFPSSQMSHYHIRASKKWGGFSDILLNKYTRIHLISAFKYFWKWKKSV